MHFILFFCIMFLYMFIYGVCMHATEHLQRSEDNSWWESVISFQHLGPGGGTQGIRPGNRHLCHQIQLTSLKPAFQISILTSDIQELPMRTGEQDQLLRVTAALAKDLNTKQSPLLAALGHCMHIVHKCRQNTNTHKREINKYFMR